VPVQIIHQRFRAFTTQLGEIFQLLVEALRSLHQQRPSGKDFLYQLQFIGVKSQSVVITTGAATGMVLCAQTFLQFHKVKMDTATGAVVSIGMSSELGPVLAALMLTGRVGAAMTAELGTMKVTEQIDALRTLAAHPVDTLVVPRFLALLASAPLLTAQSVVVGIISSWLVGVHLLGIDSAYYLVNMTRYTDPQDVLTGLIKSVVFGAIIAVVSCYKGLTCQGGAEGVGKATTEAVVVASISILITNFFLTLFLSRVFYS
jgi:phospholipid/cholesterol/gamma-HCH transport system permease protein